VPCCQKYTPADCFFGDYTQWDNRTMYIVCVLFLLYFGEDLDVLIYVCCFM